MGLRAERSAIGSPVQQHRALAANGLQLVDGTMDTLGNPHNYLNQDGMDYLLLRDAQISPWSFTGLPQSRSPQVVLIRDGVHFLLFRGEEAQSQFREAPRTSTLILNLPLAIVKGNAPFLSEAHLSNFLDFWKGLFFPVTQARIHYLATSSADLPAQVPMLYINRKAIQSYVQA
jgi:hypothetical protein